QNATSSDVAAVNGATPCSMIRRGGASPPAASTMAANANGPARRKKRGSPGWLRVSVSGPMALPLSRHDEAGAASASNGGSDPADPPASEDQCFVAGFAVSGLAAAGSAFAVLSPVAGAIANGETPSGGTTTD